MKQILLSAFLMVALVFSANAALVIVSPNPMPITVTGGEVISVIVVEDGNVSFAGPLTITGVNGTAGPVTTLAPFLATFDFTVGPDAGAVSFTISDGATMVTGTTNSLPVEIKSFTARANGDAVNLNWVTASEKNNNYFEVERSFDGTNFKAISMIDGAGNSQTEVKYSYEDSNISSQATSNNVYYRLRQTDFDGKNTTSDVVSVALSASNSLSINNVRNNGFETSVIFNSPIEGDVQLNVFDMNGRLMSRQNINAVKGNNASNISFEGTGVYIVSITNGTSTIAKQFVK